MAIKGILLDFNGTLFFDSEYHIRAFQEGCKKYGVPTFDRQYIVNEIFGKSNASIFRGSYLHDATDEQVEEFELYKEKLYTNACIADPSHLHLCNGAAEMLDHLKKNSIPYCIATGSPLENVKFYFKYLELDRWFTMDNLVYFDGSFNGKPAPDIYLLAAERLGLSPSECAVFEDGTSGILSARAAGVAKVIGIWDEALPSPTTESVYPDEEHHDLTQWRLILSDMGLKA